MGAGFGGGERGTGEAELSAEPPVLSGDDPRQWQNARHLTEHDPSSLEERDDALSRYGHGWLSLRGVRNLAAHLAGPAAWNA